MRYWRGWMYLKECSIRGWKGESRGGQDERKFNEKKWKGWNVLGGKFSEEMERLVVLEGKFSEKNGRVGMYLKKVQKRKFNERMERLGHT